MQRTKTIGEAFSCMQTKKTMVIFLIFAISTYIKRHIRKDIFVSTHFWRYCGFFYVKKPQYLACLTSKSFFFSDSYWADLEFVNTKSGVHSLKTTDRWSQWWIKRLPNDEPHVLVSTFMFWTNQWYFEAFVLFLVSFFFWFVLASAHNLCWDFKPGLRRYLSGQFPSRNMLTLTRSDFNVVADWQTHVNFIGLLTLLDYFNIRLLFLTQTLVQSSQDDIFSIPKIKIIWCIYHTNN